MNSLKLLNCNVPNSASCNDECQWPLADAPELRKDLYPGNISETNPAHHASL